MELIFGEPGCKTMKKDSRTYDLLNVQSRRIKQGL